MDKFKKTINWFLTLPENQQFLINRLAHIKMNILMAGTGQGVSSSDISCAIFDICTGFQRLKETMPDLNMTCYILDQVRSSIYD